MRHPSTVQIVNIERSTKREGFYEPYHEVTFDLISAEIPTSQLIIWIYPAFPAENLERVARTFAWSRT